LFRLFLVRSQVITKGWWSSFPDSPDPLLSRTGFFFGLLGQCYSYTLCAENRSGCGAVARGQKPNCTWLGELDPLSFAQCAVPTTMVRLLLYCGIESFWTPATPPLIPGYTWPSAEEGRWMDIDLGQVSPSIAPQLKSWLTEIYDRRRILFSVLPLPRNCAIEMRCQTVKNLIIFRLFVAFRLMLQFVCSCSYPYYIPVGLSSEVYLFLRYSGCATGRDLFAEARNW